MNEQIKRHFCRQLRALAEAPADAVGRIIQSIYQTDAQWRGSHPVNEHFGLDSISANAWAPLKVAFPDLERRDSIFISGVYEDREYVATIGHYCGNFEKNWLTIPATGKPIYIRYGEIHQVSNGKIVQSNCLWDILDVIRQAGYWPLPPSTATEGLWSGPNTADGLNFTDNDTELSRSSLAQTLLMQASLGDNNGPEHFTRQGLINMDQRNYWHPKMMWYGPGGIGTTRGLPGFVDYHQLPFRLAFPNRMSSTLWNGHEELQASLNAGHYIRVGDGNYSVTGGWPSVVSPHEGPYLGSGATGKLLQMRVMDFYHHDEGLIRENWVPIDIIYLLLQMGIDVFDTLSRQPDYKSRSVQ